MVSPVWVRQRLRARALVQDLRDYQGFTVAPLQILVDVTHEALGATLALAAQ